MKKEMLINVLQPEECRIAIVEDGILEELYVERTSQESYVGNIYKGRIVNIEPSIQAAFVDFGVGRNGFLHVSDVEPAYYRHLQEPRRNDQGGRRGNGGRDRHRGPARSPEDDTSRRGRRPVAHEAEAWEPDVSEADARAAAEAGRAARAEKLDELPSDTADLSDMPPPLANAPALSRDELGDEGAAAPETEGKEPERRAASNRGRRSGRGRGRQSRREAGPASGPPDSSPERTQPEAASSDPGSESAAAEPEAIPGPKPRFMESAERRTEKDDTLARPLDPLSVSDPDLFFPREEPAQSASVATAAREELDEPPPFAPPARPEPEPLPPQEHRGPRPSQQVEEPEDFEADEEEAPDFGAEEDELPQFEDDEDADEPPRRRPARDDRRGRRFPNNRRGGPGRPGFGRPKPLIQDIFRRGQEVLVQVIKEGIGTKGPTLSTYISIAGRYLVLMPGLNRIGVSRKIADDEQRRRLREILNELQPPKGLGFIIRTAGLDKNKKELQNDLAYLSRLWQVVVRRIRKVKAPAEIYQESDMITRTIRDTFTNDIESIWVDEKNAFDHAQEFLQIVMPRYASRIKLYDESEPMFYKYGIEDEISRIQQRHVPLPNGGSIVIDQTEALVAIDVNSGNFRADNNAEETAYQVNLLAAKEIARQLRLRDLGGVIVNDFIDMRDEKHRRSVERAMRDAVKRDRARTKVLKISAFGLIEMTRQRIRPSLKRSIFQDCPHCHGTGHVKTCESMSIDVMRLLQLAAHREHIHRIQIRVHEEVANYLLNRKRAEVSRLEEVGDIAVHIEGVSRTSPEMLEFICYDKNNNEVKFLPYDENRNRR